MRRKQTPPPRLPNRKENFHVVYRKRKDGVHSQIKWGNIVIHECHPAMTEILLQLAEKWTDDGVDIRRLSELREIQHEAAIRTDQTSNQPTK